MASKSKFSNMTYRVAEREDNIYHPKMISAILNMYLDECRKALMKGERVQLKGIGTLIPVLETHRSSNRCHLPTFNQDDVNQPYTKIKITRSNSFIQKMNDTLLKNIEDGILGLEKLPFDKQQITILRDGGFIPDEENEHDGYEEN